MIWENIRKKEILVPGRKENNVIHCFSNEGSPSRNVCSFFILHNIEKTFWENQIFCLRTYICVFSLPNKIYCRPFNLKKKHLFSKIYSIGCDFPMPKIGNDFPMPKIGCDFPMPDIAKHFDTTMQKKTGKTNSAVFRNLSGLHFQYILNGLPLFYDNKGKDVRNPFSPRRSQLIFPRSCGKGISMQQHRMQHCRHIWYFSQYTLSWNLTFARSRGREAFQYSTRSERSQDFQKQVNRRHSKDYK